ncbi:MAG: beta-galactosidase [Kiritimatiellia bacterium]
MRIGVTACTVLGIMSGPVSHATAEVAPDAPLAPGAARLTLEAFDPGKNLVSNGSFENAATGIPTGWLWDRRNTDATLTLDTQNPHTGRASVKITNGTAFGAHVFGTLWLADPIPVKPNTRYTYSAFIKTGAADPGVWIGGGEGWLVRLVLPATRSRWQRISRTFVTGERETSFQLRICTDRPTEAVWIDDLSLREGDRPLPAALEGTTLSDFLDLAPAVPPEVMHGNRTIPTRWAPERWPCETWTFCADAFKAEGVVTVADASRPAVVEVTLSDGAGRTVVSQRAALAAGARSARMTLRARLSDPPPERLDMTLRLVRDGQTRVSSTGTVNLVSATRVRAAVVPVAAARDRLRATVEQLEQRGLGAASRVTLTVLDNFVPWVDADLASGKIDRAWDTAGLLQQMAAREEARARAILDGQATDFPVPRYVTGPLEISRAQAIGTRRHPDGRTERGPVLLTGYGHFGQVKNDIEKLPGYGCNIIQVEFGPNSVLPQEDETSDHAINEFLALCDRAAQANVSVILLLSPHYFPQWAFEKWPDLAECRGGFFTFCVHDPRARSVLEKSLRQVIPRVMNHPALHSVCLSNEPIGVDLSACRVTAKAWPAWLEKRHGTIAALNARWGTTHADFASIPVPAPVFVATPACLDFIRFNSETFAGFHRWMADLVHEMAPGLAVHAKIMMGAHFIKTLHGFWSVDPEAFAALSQYNGNDAYSLYDKTGGTWNNGWRHCQAGYDYQRSMADLPVVNSENHLIADRDVGVIPPAHLYATLWQNAIHGQSTTTIWVWERCNDDVSDLAGSILHRPDCVEAVGRCGLDLNRLAYEIAALQNLAPEVVLLWSRSSVVLGTDHEHVLDDTYEAANFLGRPLGFASEQKLEEAVRTGVLPRPLDTAKVLLLPQVTHLPDAAREGIKKLRAAGVRVVAIGAMPERNDYNQAKRIQGLETLAKPRDARALFPLLTARAAAWGLPPAPQVTDAAGRPLFGVEIRSTPYQGGVVASVCNHLREPQAISLAGLPAGARTELITGRALGDTVTAEPMVPLLIKSHGR